MLTGKKVVIPIYDVKLMILIFDEWSEIKSALPEEEADIESKAITWTRSINDFSSIGVAINYRHKLSAVHEAEHIKNMIWEYIGYTPLVWNDEVDAYLIKYIYTEIKKVIIAHMCRKQNHR